MTAREETLALSPGTCRFCGCTETRACSFPASDGPLDLEANFSIDEILNAPETLACWWVDSPRTLCSNPRCLAQIPLEALDNFRRGTLRKAAGQ